MLLGLPGSKFDTKDQRKNQHLPDDFWDRRPVKTRWNFIVERKDAAFSGGLGGPWQLVAFLCWIITLPKTNTKAPENRPGPKRKRSYSNHPCSGVKMLVSRTVLHQFDTKYEVFSLTCHSSGLLSFAKKKSNRCHVCANLLRFPRAK